MHDGELFVSTPIAPTLAVLPIAKGEMTATGLQVLQPAGWPSNAASTSGPAML